MPATPTLSLTPSNSDGSVEVRITNSDSPDYNQLWMSEAGATAIMIGNNIAVDGGFTVHCCRSGISYSFFARAVDGTDFADSAIHVASVTLSKLHINAAVRYSRTSTSVGDRLTLVNLMPEGLTITRASRSFDHAGQTGPFIGTSDITQRVLTCTVTIGEDDTTSLRRLRALKDARTTLLFRDQQGVGMYGTLAELTPVYEVTYVDVAIVAEENSYSPAIDDTQLYVPADALALEDSFILLLEDGYRLLLG